ncbi:hypothetical protein MKW06_001727 [Escherichia coli]|nr:hypothetical protein [Escherichia coli]
MIHTLPLETQTVVVTRFISDVCEHRMTVLQDNGVYRHLRFAQPGTSCYYFDIVTWPGYLAVTGDMGTWTFSRTRDMFNFFGGAFEKGVNAGYWSEKLEAGAGRSAHDFLAQEYDHDEFCVSLKEQLSTYFEEDEEEVADVDWDDESDEPDSDKAKIREIVRDLCRENHQSAELAYHAVYEAYWPQCVDTWELCSDINYKTYSVHFLWILHAIVWGIGKYHNTKLVDRSMSVYLGFNSISKESSQ